METTIAGGNGQRSIDHFNFLFLMVSVSMIMEPLILLNGNRMLLMTKLWQMETEKEIN
jgi:hypothetical protein